MHIIGKTDHERFYNYQTYNIKHHDWNNDALQYHQTKNFNVSTQNNFRYAYFVPMNPITAINSRAESSVFFDADMEFKDPWYLFSGNVQQSDQNNAWVPNSNPNWLKGAFDQTSGGVFLDQEYIPSQPNKPYYSIRVPQYQDKFLTQTGKTHRFYLNDWTISGPVNVVSPSLCESLIVFSGTGVTITANLKGTQLSNDQNAYANSSQRKFVRTPDDYLHHVYQSMDRVWYELSTNNGATWQIMNNGRPLSGNQSKLPSIDYYGNVISIVWQELNGSGYDIKLSSFYLYGNQYIIGNNAVTIYNEQNESYSENANPVIGWGYNAKAIILWEGKYWGPFGGQDGIGYSYCTISYNSITFYSNAGIALTNENSITPTIATLSNISDPICFRIAYVQKYSEEASDIYHCLLTIDASDTISVSDISNVSAGAGFTKNTKPSMIAASDYNGTGSRLCWIGYREGEVWIDPEGQMYIEGSETSEQKVIFMDPDYREHYWNFGSLVQSTSINISNTCYAITWGMDNSTAVQFTDGNQRQLSYISTLDVQGKDIQMCNGSGITDMRVMAFNSEAQPYYFDSDNLNAYPPKLNLVSIGSGREGVVYKDSSRFYFAIGDVKVNNQPIKFIEVDDTITIYNKQRLNELLISEPFSLNDNSNFIYSVQYGITDSSAAVYVLDIYDFVNFKVELRDDQTGELVGLFDDITFNETNVAQYNNIAYQVNTQGIGNRTVRLRLVTDNNFDPKYSLADRYAQDNALLKSNFKQVSFQGSLAVDNYDLSQNYPNPFNPTTTINYQIKEDGLVTLKIYDILGAEVKSLVNEEKSRGRYVYNFNGSELASGVYIYQLRVNDFVSSKKLMLLK